MVSAASGDPEPRRDDRDEEGDERTALDVLAGGLDDFENRRTVMAVDGALLACMRILCHVCTTLDRHQPDGVRASDRLLFQLLPLEKATAGFQSETARS